MRIALVCLVLLLSVASPAGAQPRPVASAQVSATLGKYQPAHHAWAVVVEWRVTCAGGSRFAWTVYLRGRPNGEYVTSNGFSSVGTGRRVLLLPARERSYEVVPEITARCFTESGDVSSEYVTAYGAPLTIPPEPAGDGGVGDDYLHPDGDFDHRRRGGDGNGHGGYGGGGTTVPLTSVCVHAVAGTTGDDVLNGTELADTLLGFGGDDRVRGRGGRDCILGHAGRDVLSGGAGGDVIDGGFGRDVLRAGGGRNRLHGGAGNDVLDAVNGRRDIVNCGPGRRDVSRADAVDVVMRCERRQRR